MTRHWLSACVLALVAPAVAIAQPDPVVPPVDETPVVVAPAVVVARPAPAVVVPPPKPDVDVSAYELEAARPDEHINIYGFADFGWQASLAKRTSLAAGIFPKENSFLVGNVNLYITKNLSPHWRSLFEVRYLYAPSNITAAGTYQSTVAPDPADIQRPLQWGGIAIERVYLEYEVNESLTIQAGSFLTPYGIWNVDHGSPTIIPVARPYIIGESLFPAQQTGLHLYGKHAVGRYTVGYHATLTNGRGPLQGFRDLDDNKALGARLELETPWLDGVKFGLSGYRGRYTDRPADVIAPDASGNLVTITPAGTSYDELAYGADVALHRGGLYVQAEVIGNDRRYRVGARELASGGFLADGREFGAYLLAGFRFDRLWQVMPFAILELDRLRPQPDLGSDGQAKTATVGLNFRPDPSVALKLQYTETYVDSSLLHSELELVVAQAAWAF